MLEGVENWLKEKLASLRAWVQAESNYWYAIGLLVGSIVVLVAAWYVIYSKAKENAWWWVPLLLLTAVAGAVLLFTGLTLFTSLLGSNADISPDTSIKVDDVSTVSK